MAMDTRGTGFVLLRIFIGTFFVFMGLKKLQWFGDSSILAAQLTGWLDDVRPGSVSSVYLTRVAIPGVAFFARLVPLGELASGLALIVGWKTPLAAFVALFMVVNFHVASGLMFTYGYLTNGYGLPVLGSTLALAVGGSRLPWSLSH